MVGRGVGEGDGDYIVGKLSGRKGGGRGGWRLYSMKLEFKEGGWDGQRKYSGSSRDCHVQA